MTNPRPSSRRSGWVALLAATGVVLGGAFAVRRNRRKREERRPKAGESYRWRVRGTATTDWSPWCQFTIAATTLDSLNLGEDRLLTAGLPPSRWRDIAAVLGPGWPHGDTPWYWSIQEAGSRVSAGEVPVSLRAGPGRR